MGNEAVSIFLGPIQGWAGIPVPVHSQEWKPLIPFPELWEWIFSFPSRSRISGMLFFIPFPFPNYGNGFFIPFLFPNFGNGFFSGSSWKGSERTESTRIWNKALIQKERLKRNSRIMKTLVQCQVNPEIDCLLDWNNWKTIMTRQRVSWAVWMVPRLHLHVKSHW